MSQRIKELECAYDALDEARKHLSKAEFYKWTMRTQDIYEEVEETLNMIYEMREEEE